MANVNGQSKKTLSSTTFNLMSVWLGSAVAGKRWLFSVWASSSMTSESTASGVAGLHQEKNVKNQFLQV